MSTKYRAQSIKIAEFIEPVFDAKVVVISGCTYHRAIIEAKKMRMKLDDEKEHEWAGAVSFTMINDDHKSKLYLLWLADRFAFYTIVHEAVHICKKIFCDRGIAFCSENDETMAYYIMYLVKKIWHAVGLGGK